MKHQVFGMFSSVKKKHLNAKSYLEDFSLEKESSKIQRLADTYGKLKRTNSISKEKRTSLVTEVKKEKSRPSRQKKMMGEIIRMIQLPENDLGEEVFRLQEGFFEHHNGWKLTSLLSLTEGLKVEPFTSPYSDAMCEQVQFSTSPSKMRSIIICASGKHLRTFLHRLEFIFVHLHILKSDMSSFKVDSNFK